MSWGFRSKIAEGEYKKLTWADFSQEDLREFAKNPKIEPFVQPFIELDPKALKKKTEVNIKEPPRLPQPAKQSLLGALFSSSLGLSMMFLLYAAIIYAGYEVAVFRAQPPALVCGLAAIPFLGIFSPIAFLALPTKLKPTESAHAGVEAPAEDGAPASGDATVNPMQADGAAHPVSLKIAHSEPDRAKTSTPEVTTFQRGQFTFNRRFFETKFAGFFGVVRRDAEKDMLLVIKSTRGEYAGDRISRIAANDLHLQVHRGHATEEVLIPFQEIQEIRLKRKGT